MGNGKKIFLKEKEQKRLTSFFVSLVCGLSLLSSAIASDDERGLQASSSLLARDVRESFSQRPLSASEIKEIEEQNKSFLRTRRNLHITAASSALTGSLWLILSYLHCQPALQGSLEKGISLRELENHLNAPSDHPVLAIAGYGTPPLFVTSLGYLKAAQSKMRQLSHNGVPYFSLQIENETSASQKEGWFNRLMDGLRSLSHKWIARLTKASFPWRVPGMSGWISPSPQIAQHFQDFSVATYAKVLDIDLSGFQGLSPADIGFLLQLPNLRALNLSDTGLTDEYVYMFPYTTSLEELDIRFNLKISADVLHQLMNNMLTHQNHTWFTGNFQGLSVLKGDARQDVIVQSGLLRTLFSPTNSIQVSALGSPFREELSSFLADYRLFYHHKATLPDVGIDAEKTIRFTEKDVLISPQLSDVEAEPKRLQEFLEKSGKYWIKQNPKIMPGEEVEITNHFIVSLITKSNSQSPLASLSHASQDISLSIEDLEKKDPALTLTMKNFEDLVQYGLINELMFQKIPLNLA